MPVVPALWRTLTTVTPVVGARSKDFEKTEHELMFKRPFEHVVRSESAIGQVELTWLRP